MIHVFKKSSSKLKTFIKDNDICQTDLLANHIEVESLRKNKLPLSWRSLSDIVHAKRQPSLEFMNQIKDGLKSYLGREVQMSEIFDI